MGKDASTITNEQLLKAMEELTHAIRDNSISTATSSATDILLSIVPIVGIVFGVVLLFFYFLWQYRKTKELIRTNQYQHEVIQNLRTWTLLMGCLSSIIGLPLTILFYAIQGPSYGLLGGLIPFAAGLGFLLFYILSRPKD